MLYYSDFLILDSRTFKNLIFIDHFIFTYNCFDRSYFRAVKPFLLLPIRVTLKAITKTILLSNNDTLTNCINRNYLLLGIYM